jgi:hypothetical protein
MPDFTSGITCFYNGGQLSAFSFQPDLALDAAGIEKGAFVIK